MRMIKTTTILLLLLGFQTAFATNKAMVKANIMRGESFVTANTTPEDVERIISQALINQGYQIVEKVIPDEEIFYVDIFVFQFPAEYPTITLTIRTKNGIHFIDKESIKLFGNRNRANLNLASRLAERIPRSINTKVFYEPTFRHIFSSNRVSLTGMSSNAITKGYRSSYSSYINWADNNSPEFFLPGEFDTYMAHASNFLGIRRQLRGNKITLELRIDSGAKFELVGIDSPISLTERQKERIQEFVNAFPLWAIDSPLENIELVLSIN